MELLKLLLGWPYLSVKGFIRLAELLRDQAEQELYDPSAVQRQLHDVSEARATGHLSDEEVSELEYEAVARLIQQPQLDVAQGPPNGGER